MGLGIVIGIRIGDWDWRLGLVIGDGDLGFIIEIGDWDDGGSGLGIGNSDWGEISPKTWHILWGCQDSE